MATRAGRKKPKNRETGPNRRFGSVPEAASVMFSMTGSVLDDAAVRFGLLFKNLREPLGTEASTHFSCFHAFLFPPCLPLPHATFSSPKSPFSSFHAPFSSPQKSSLPLRTLSLFSLFLFCSSPLSPIPLSLILYFCSSLPLSLGPKPEALSLHPSPRPPRGDASLSSTQHRPPLHLPRLRRSTGLPFIFLVFDASPPSNSSLAVAFIAKPPKSDGWISRKARLRLLGHQRRALDAAPADVGFGSRC